MTDKPTSPAIEKARETLDPKAKELAGFTYAEMIFSLERRRDGAHVLKIGRRAKAEDPALIPTQSGGSPIADDAGEAEFEFINPGENGAKPQRETRKVKSWEQFEGETEEALAELNAEVEERKLDSYVEKAMDTLKEAELKRIAETIAKGDEPDED